jgi:hypothetical protein
MRPSRFPAFLLGLIVGLIIVPACVYCYFRFGFAPVATGATAMPFEKRFARMGLHGRMDKEYPRSAPIQGNEENYSAGMPRGNRTTHHIGCQRDVPQTAATS